MEGTGMNRYKKYKLNKTKQLKRTNRQCTWLDELTQEQEHDLLQHMTRSELKQLRLIKHSISLERESLRVRNCMATTNKQVVLATNDIELCQWAGITEEEYNNSKLEE